jgi:hypothetical protein
VPVLEIAFVDVGIDIGDVGYGMDMLYQYNQDEYWMD